MTRAGVIMGTAAYMSPEQARGRAVDTRADIWAFGAVLYEMVTGRRPFMGEDLAETIASVVKDQPDLEKAPPPVRRLIARCLDKDPRRRLRDIGDAWDLLDETQSAAAVVAVPASRHVAPWAIAGAFALLAAAAGVLYLRQPAAQPAGVVRFQVSAPLQAGGATVSLSPDGRHIAYQAGNRIWVRDLDALTPRMVAMTDSAVAMPFWTGDSRFVVYDAGGKLTKVDASGEAPPLALCDLSGIMLGGFGTHDDRVVFVSVPGGIQQIPSRGGTPAPVGAVRLGSLQGGNRLLPGDRFVYAAEERRAATSGAQSGIYTAALDGTGEPVQVLAGEVRQVAYVPSRDGDSGYLLFTRGSTLLAQRFDSARNELLGEPVAVADRVGGFSASETGTLVHVEEGDGRRLVWVDRDGTQGRTVWAPGDYNELRLSPDGSKVAVVRQAGTSTWVHDFAREASHKVSSFPTSSVKPVWSPDGTRVLYSGNREGNFDLYVAAANGAGNDQLVLKSPNFKYVLSWSRDDRWLLYANVDRVTKEDLWVLPMTGNGERKPEPFLVTNYRETDAAFSPDGRFVAYVSDETGTPEVYVRSFPVSAGGKWPVSNGGGYQPRWRADGKELLYLSGRSQLMSVETTPGKDFVAASPKALFTATVFGGGPTVNNWYWDVAPDGKRMLFNAGSTASGTSLVTVVLNWQAGLKAGS
jgi:Tol biopolymer transport system component